METFVQFIVCVLLFHQWRVLWAIDVQITFRCHMLADLSWACRCPQRSVVLTLGDAEGFYVVCDTDSKFHLMRTFGFGMLPGFGKRRKRSSVENGDNSVLEDESNLFDITCSMNERFRWDCKCPERNVVLMLQESRDFFIVCDPRGSVVPMKSASFGKVQQTGQLINLFEKEEEKEKPKKFLRQDAPSDTQIRGSDDNLGQFEKEVEKSEGLIDRLAEGSRENHGESDHENNVKTLQNSPLPIYSSKPMNSEMKSAEDMNNPARNKAKNMNDTELNNSELNKAAEMNDTALTNSEYMDNVELKDTENMNNADNMNELPYTESKSIQQSTHNLNHSTNQNENGNFTVGDDKSGRTSRSPYFSTKYPTQPLKTTVTVGKDVLPIEKTIPYSTNSITTKNPSATPNALNTVTRVNQILDILNSPKSQQTTLTTKAADMYFKQDGKTVTKTTHQTSPKSGSTTATKPPETTTTSYYQHLVKVLAKQSQISTTKHTDTSKTTNFPKSSVAMVTEAPATVTTMVSREPVQEIKTTTQINQSDNDTSGDTTNDQSGEVFTTQIVQSDNKERTTTTDDGMDATCFVFGRKLKVGETYGNKYRCFYECRPYGIKKRVCNGVNI